MNEEAIIKVILDEAFYVHKEIGPGMLEKVYQHCLAYRLSEKRGLLIEIEKPIPVIFEEVSLEVGYRADIVVEKIIVIETKSIEAIADIHIASMLTYLKFLQLRHGLILNFKSVLLKNGIKRVVNGY